MPVFVLVEERCWLALGGQFLSFVA